MIQVLSAPSVYIPLGYAVHPFWGVPANMPGLQDTTYP